MTVADSTQPIEQKDAHRQTHTVVGTGPSTDEGQAPGTDKIEESDGALSATNGSTPFNTTPPFPSYVMEGRLKRRPVEISGFTRNVTAPEGKVNITINSDSDGPLEVFINVGRAGSDVAALAEALGRLVSLHLRMPSTMSQEERLRHVARQLQGIGGSRSIGFGKNRVLSLPDAVGHALALHVEEHSMVPPAEQLNQSATRNVCGDAAPAAQSALTGNLCPQCGSSGAYVYEEGCKKCYSCGHSEC